MGNGKKIVIQFLDGDEPVSEEPINEEVTDDTPEELSPKEPAIDTQARIPKAELLQEIPIHPEYSPARAETETFVDHNYYEEETGGRVKRSARRLTLSFVTFFILVGAGGLVYTWYSDGHTKNTPLPVAPVSDQSRPITPPKVSPNATEGASVEMLDSPVAPGTEAAMTVHTNPTSTCQIKVVYKSVPSTAAGLVTETADNYGEVSWSWTIDKTAPAGTWPVTVTCVYHGRSAVVIGDLQVVR